MLKVEPVKGFPNTRVPMAREPHTTEDQCLGHDFYLMFTGTNNQKQDWATYKCRFCGKHRKIFV